MQTSKKFDSSEQTITPIKVLIVEDHELLRLGLKYALQASNEVCVTGIACDGPSAVEMARELQPDLILMDVSLPGFSGIEATIKLKHNLPARILMFSSHHEYEIINQALDAGADGYCLKNAPTNKLLEAIHAVMRGRVWLDDSISDELLHKKRAASSQ